MTVQKNSSEISDACNSSILQQYLAFFHSAQKSGADTTQPGKAQRRKCLPRSLPSIFTEGGASRYGSIGRKGNAAIKFFMAHPLRVCKVYLYYKTCIIILLISSFFRTMRPSLRSFPAPPCSSNRPCPRPSEQLPYPRDNVLEHKFRQFFVQEGKERV